MCVMTRVERQMELVVLVVEWRGWCWWADSGEAMELGIGDGGRCLLASKIQGMLTLAGCSCPGIPLWCGLGPNPSPLLSPHLDVSQQRQDN